MSGVGTFPFGWVRGVRSDNWQLIWDPKTKILTAKGVSSKKIVMLGESPNWEDAKAFADKVIKDPSSYLEANGKAD
jgi:hypothetical protein